MIQTTKLSYQLPEEQDQRNPKNAPLTYTSNPTLRNRWGRAESTAVPTI